jgi:hypothetical protein
VPRERSYARTTVDTLARAVLGAANRDDALAAGRDRYREIRPSREIEGILPEEVPASCVRTGGSENCCIREKDTG